MVFSQPGVQVIETGRLVMTPLTVEDAEPMVRVLADPLLYAFTGGEPPTLGQLRQRYARQVVGHSDDGSQQWLNWIVRTRADRQRIGTVQATIAAAGTLAEIAWVVGVPWQGRGYAREAAAALVGWLRDGGLDRISAHVHPAHRASEAVARAAGLEPTNETDDGERLWTLDATRAGRPDAAQAQG